MTTSDEFWLQLSAPDGSPPGPAQMRALALLRAAGFVTVRETTLQFARMRAPALGPLQPGATGIDVSEFNGVLDWDAIAAWRGPNGEKVEFAAIRRTTGLRKDAQGDRNWAEARRVGIRRIPYHYAHWDKDGLEQARFFLDVLGADRGELPPWWDVEPRKKADNTYEVVDRPLNTRRTRAALRLIEETHAVPDIYTALWAWPLMVDVDSAADLSDHYPLAVADYAGPIDYPPGWTTARYHQTGTKEVAGKHLDWDVYLGEPVMGPARPWWEARLPPYELQLPNKVVQFYRADGSELLAREVKWVMDVFERSGDLLRVTQGLNPEWWVRADAVQPV